MPRPDADLSVCTTDLAPLLRGHLELETTARGVLPHRLPGWARAQCPDPQLLMAESQPAGVRLVFTTAATRIALEVVATKRAYAGAGRRPDGVHQLVVDGEVVAAASATVGDLTTIDPMTGHSETRQGPVATLDFGGLGEGDKEVVLWLPHDETTTLVALHTDAPVVATVPRPVTWVHHGSSISQGSNASHPTATWPVVAARGAGVEVVNLGLGGSALLDPFVARVIRDADASLISLELGINLVNTDLIRRRALGPALHGFLDTIRDGHPETPITLISPLLCPIHEETPGPTGFDPEALARGEVRFVATGDPTEVPAGRLTLAVVREEMARVADQRGDAHLRLLDGRELYGDADHELHPLPDSLHLDEGAHALVGGRFAQWVLRAHPVRPRSQ